MSDNTLFHRIDEDEWILADREFREWKGFIFYPLDQKEIRILRRFDLWWKILLVKFDHKLRVKHEGKQEIPAKKWHEMIWAVCCFLFNFFHLSLREKN